MCCGSAIPPGGRTVPAPRTREDRTGTTPLSCHVYITSCCCETERREIQIATRHVPSTGRFGRCQRQALFDPGVRKPRRGGATRASGVSRATRVGWCRRDADRGIGSLPRPCSYRPRDCERCTSWVRDQVEPGPAEQVVLPGCNLQPRARQSNPRCGVQAHQGSSATRSPVVGCASCSCR